MPVAFAAVQSQSFNGTGSQTAFTISRSVPSAASLEVLVNNVQQSPYDGSYSVNGTTLTFSEAPSSGTNNVYVIYRDQALGSLVDQTAYRKAEADSLLAAKVSKTGDTMTGALGVGATPLANLHSTKAGAEVARFTNSQSNGGDWEFKIGGGGFEDRKFMLTDKYGGSDNVRLARDSAGRVTMPYQPAFFAYRSPGAGHISGTGNGVFDATRFNRGNHYSTSNGRFTAPVAGVYFFAAIGLPIGTVNYTYMKLFKNGSLYSGDTYVINADQSVSVSCAIELSVGDYVTVYYIDGSEQSYSHFSGFLIG